MSLHRRIYLAAHSGTFGTASLGRAGAVWHAGWVIAGLAALALIAFAAADWTVIHLAAVVGAAVVAVFMCEVRWPLLALALAFGAAVFLLPTFVGADSVTYLIPSLGTH